jgi:ribosomal subunit interface protein
MKVQIRARDATVSEALRIHVAERLGLALGRFADRIGQVVVWFSDVAGDKRCRIEVGLLARKLKVEGMHGDGFAAVDHAVSRISSSIARALEREQDSADGWPRGTGK